MQLDDFEPLIRRAYDIARSAVAHGNHPFGALLVHDGTVVAESENEVVTTGDVTRHAETCLVARVSPQFDSERLTECTLVTSTEPCIMCCGAIHWAAIGRIVFGVRGQKMVETFDAEYNGIVSRDVFKKLNPNVEIVGPVLEEEGLVTHRDFWPEFLGLV